MYLWQRGLESKVEPETIRVNWLARVFCLINQILLKSHIGEKDDVSTQENWKKNLRDYHSNGEVWGQGRKKKQHQWFQVFRYSKFFHILRTCLFIIFPFLIPVCPSPLSIFFFGFRCFVNFGNLYILRKLSFCCDLFCKYINFLLTFLMLILGTQFIL